MRNTSLWPQTPWSIVCKNLGEAPGDTKAACSKVDHDILPTNERIYRIRMVHTDTCRKCVRMDTLAHHLTECGDGEQIWTWTKQRLAWKLRTVPERIPRQWLLRLHFTLWPPRGRRPVLWILAKLFVLRTQQQRELTSQDFIDIMKRSKWKRYQPHKRERVGKYCGHVTGPGEDTTRSDISNESRIEIRIGVAKSHTSNGTRVNGSRELTQYTVGDFTQ